MLSETPGTGLLPLLLPLVPPLLLPLLLPESMGLYLLSYAPMGLASPDRVDMWYVKARKTMTATRVSVRCCRRAMAAMRVAELRKPLDIDCGRGFRQRRW
jgi:hypothetical protein